MLQFISSSVRPIESRSNCFKLLPRLALSILIEARLLFRPVLDKWVFCSFLLFSWSFVLFYGRQRNSPSVKDPCKFFSCTCYLKFVKINNVHWSQFSSKQMALCIRGYLVLPEATVGNIYKLLQTCREILIKFIRIPVNIRKFFKWHMLHSRVYSKRAM